MGGSPRPGQWPTNPSTVRRLPTHGKHGVRTRQQLARGALKKQNTVLEWNRHRQRRFRYRTETIRRFRYRTRQGNSACRDGFWNGPLIFTMDYLMLRSGKQPSAVAREPRGAGNEPKRERTRGERRSILLRAGRWLQHQFDLLNRGLEGHHRVDRHAQMGHDNAVPMRCVADCHVSEGFQREVHNPGAVAISCRSSRYKRTVRRGCRCPKPGRLGSELSR